MATVDSIVAKFKAGETLSFVEIQTAVPALIRRVERLTETLNALWLKHHDEICLCDCFESGKCYYPEPEALKDEPDSVG